MFFVSSFRHFGNGAAILPLWPDIFFGCSRAPVELVSRSLPLRCKSCWVTNGLETFESFLILCSARTCFRRKVKCYPVTFVYPTLKRSKKILSTASARHAYAASRPLSG